MGQPTTSNSPYPHAHVLALEAIASFLNTTKSLYFQLPQQTRIELALSVITNTWKFFAPPNLNRLMEYPNFNTSSVQSILFRIHSDLYDLLSTTAIDVHLYAVEKRWVAPE